MPTVRPWLLPIPTDCIAVLTLHPRTYTASPYLHCIARSHVYLTHAGPCSNHHPPHASLPRVCVCAGCQRLLATLLAFLAVEYQLGALYAAKRTRSHGSELRRDTWRRTLAWMRGFSLDANLLAALFIISGLVLYMLDSVKGLEAPFSLFADDASGADADAVLQDGGRVLKALGHTVHSWETDRVFSYLTVASD